MKKLIVGMAATALLCSAISASANTMSDAQQTVQSQVRDRTASVQELRDLSVTKTYQIMVLYDDLMCELASMKPRSEVSEQMVSEIETAEAELKKIETELRQEEADLTNLIQESSS